MSSLPLRSLVLVSLLLSPACGEAPLPRPGDSPALQPSGVDAPRPTLASLLHAGAALELDVAASAEQPSAVSFRLSGELAVDEPTSVMQLAGGQITLWLHDDGSLEVAGLSFELDDVSVEPQPMLPDGLVLTAIEVALTAATLDAVTWQDGGSRLSGSGQLDLRLHWAWHPVDDAEDIHPLASQTVDELAMNLTVSYDEGLGLRAELAAERQGQVWSMANILGDGDLVAMHDPVLALRSAP